MNALITMLAVVWALPWTMFGMFWGTVGLLAGGRVGRTGRMIEFWGGGVGWFLRFFPIIRGAAAVTFGHTVLARDREQLDRCRAHEAIHVRQYERWGPFFVPAYLANSIYQWLRGRNAYLDNVFEREAYDKAP